MKGEGRMQQELLSNGRRTRTRVAVLACAWLVACAKVSPPAGGADGESHFLHGCEQGCPDGLTCIEQRCTAVCDGDDACHALSGEATCVPGAGGEASRCDVTCASQDDCEALGERFVCADEYCRVAPAGSGK